MATRNQDDFRQHGQAREQAGDGRPGREQQEAGNDTDTRRLGYDQRYNTSGRRQDQDVRQFGGDRGYGGYGTGSSERSYSGQSEAGRQGAFNAPPANQQRGHSGYGTFGSHAGQSGHGGQDMHGPSGYGNDYDDALRGGEGGYGGQGARGGAGYVGSAGFAGEGSRRDQFSQRPDDRGRDDRQRPTHGSGSGQRWSGQDTGRETGRDWRGMSEQSGHGGYRDDQQAGRRYEQDSRRGSHDWQGQAAPQGPEAGPYGPPTAGLEEPGGRHDWSGSRGQGGYSGQRGYGAQEHDSFGGWSSASSHQQRGGPKGYKRSDERLQDEIVQRIMQSDRIDASDVTIRVEDGNVTLEGNVRSRGMKFELEDLVDRVVGVRDIDNRLRIAGSGGTSGSGGKALGSGSSGSSSGSSGSASGPQ